VTDAADAYRKRFQKVLDFVETHLEDELTVDRLSDVAAFSKYHFHRQFSAIFGVGVHKYVQLLRLKRASYELAFRESRRVIDVAMESGYESHEAFSRAFKKSFGQTPSEFRDQPDWESWHAAYRPLTELRSQHMKPEFEVRDVRIIDFPETRVATLEYAGDPRLLGDAIRRFIAWRKANDLGAKTSATYNVLHNDPYQVPPEEYRVDLCAATPRPVPPNDAGVVERKIPGGRCATLRLVGSDDGLGAALLYLYRTWLPESGEEPRDFPPFVQRVTFFPDVPENEAIHDVFMPLR
jgi:AraC family transcriptional regulator